MRQKTVWQVELSERRARRRSRFRRRRRRSSRRQTQMQTVDGRRQTGDGKMLASDRSESSTTEQAKQRKAEQSRAQQGKARQGKAKHRNAGGRRGSRSWGSRRVVGFWVRRRQSGVASQEQQVGWRRWRAGRGDAVDVARTGRVVLLGRGQGR